MQQLLQSTVEEWGRSQAFDFAPASCQWMWFASQEHMSVVIMLWGAKRHLEADEKNTLEYTR